MATSPEAYVDASAFIAFMDGSDTHHPLFARLFATPPRLVTTSLVIAEGLHLTGVRKTRSCWSTDRHLRLTGIPLVIDQA